MKYFHHALTPKLRLLVVVSERDRCLRRRLPLPTKNEEKDTDDDDSPNFVFVAILFSPASDDDEPTVVDAAAKQKTVDANIIYDIFFVIFIYLYYIILIIYCSCPLILPLSLLLSHFTLFQPFKVNI